jgi:hypothetical protein
MNAIAPVPLTPAGDEAQTLLSALGRIPATFAWKRGGLDAAGTNARLGTSTITAGDWEWVSAADDSPEELLALWQAAVARSRAAVVEALADAGLDLLAARPAHRGAALKARRIVADLIEEYACHTGQADLIRESVDGLVGEDPTQP